MCRGGRVTTNCKMVFFCHLEQQLITILLHYRETVCCHYSDRTIKDQKKLNLVLVKGKVIYIITKTLAAHMQYKCQKHTIYLGLCSTMR